MKKYITVLLAAVLCALVLAGCGGSGKSVQQPAEETKEQAAQPEKTEETGTKEDTDQADAAQDSAQAAADTAADSDAYLVIVKDAETMAPIQGVRVQFCSDSMCLPDGQDR
jgi:predicted small secreted protein